MRDEAGHFDILYFISVKYRVNYLFLISVLIKKDDNVEMCVEIKKISDEAWDAIEARGEKWMKEDTR